MKGMFIPEITVEMFRNGCLESIEALMAEGEVYDIEYDPKSEESEINKQKLIRTMNAGIIATNTEDVYSCGMRNGIRWCRALLEDAPPKFEDASQYAEPERQNGEWLDYSDEGYVECPFCHSATNCDGNKDELHYCFSCGAELR